MLTVNDKITHSGNPPFLTENLLAPRCGKCGSLRCSRLLAADACSSGDVIALEGTYLKHVLQPDDNFVRLSLKYHVEVDDIKRANNLYQNDSIHSK